MVLFGIVVTGQGTFATGVAASTVPPAAVSVIPCSLAQPGSITQALVCTNKSEAMRRLDAVACLSAQVPQVLEVLAVWRGRNALPEGAAARDPVIGTFMADCLVNASLGLHPIEPPEPSAELYLRKALNDPSDLIVGAAIAGLMPVLTPEDVATIAGIGSRRPGLSPCSVTSVMPGQRQQLGRFEPRTLDRRRESRSINTWPNQGSCVTRRATQFARNFRHGLRFRSPERG